jgi:hypothetical protein
LSKQTYLSLRPGVYQAWQESLQGEGVPDMPSLNDTVAETRLLESKRSDFFFFLALRNAGFSRESVCSLCRAGVAGVDIVGNLNELIQPSDPSLDLVNLSTWWKVQLTDLLSEPVALFDSLTASAQWIEALSGIDDFVQLGIEVKNLRDLWRYRADERVRDLIVIRLGKMVAHMDRVNPAYQNAQQSLGLLYEGLLKGKKEHAFLFSLSAFLGDLTDAEGLRKDVIEALSEDSINE